MFAALSVAPATNFAISVPFVVTLVLAIAALVAIAIHLRALRRSGRLTAASGSVGAVGAALVLAGALLVCVSVSAPAASALAATVAPAVQATTPPAISEDLDGFQLPTE